MKKYLLSPEKKQFKINPHCHTLFSDGNLTPAQVKELYARNGYSAVAFTDHDLFVTHDELNDEGFLALHGYEVEINEPGRPWPLTRTCHMCFIAKNPEIRQPVCLHREKYSFGRAVSHLSEMQYGDMEDYTRAYTPECINDMAKKAREAGFFVSYNHPSWSMEDAAVYTRYREMDALEIYNYGCLITGYDDSDGHAYEDLLRAGRHIGCTGSDDNHNEHPADSPESDSLGAFTYVLADSLSYENLMQGLETGEYYASRGPQIHAILVEDGKLQVDCSPVRSIEFRRGCRNNSGCYAEKDKTLCHGETEIQPEFDGYIRVTVTDREGRTADSRGYFMEELI